MRFDGSRTKKLVVAFHFQFANTTAWGCDGCRQSGLESKRRCGWQENATATAARVVWARGTVSCNTCPVSYITAESKWLLDEFQAWKLFGVRDHYALPAKLVDAIFILENEIRTEMRNAQE